MDGEDASGSGPHGPCTESELRSSNGAATAVELSNVNISHPMGGSETVGAPVTVSSDSVADGEAVPASVGVVEVKAEMKVAEIVSGKRKRGRPPRDQTKQQPLKMRKEDEEEDVCFICFDGGRLVMCDRRGCPKAYHPVCIKRDEAFFRSRGKWNCGWHICSSCQKTAHYMCYTCTYSLCKACTKYADYVCVRENKGFCTTCMKTIMLVENNGQGNREMVQVDFDDQGSWEYLFKVYWVLLKGKLSLTLNELTQAQNPWKAAGTAASKAKSLNVHFGGNDGKVSISDSTSGHLEANKDGTVASKAKSLDVHFGANDAKVSISDGMSGHPEANKAGTVASKAKSLDVHFGGNDGKVSISNSMSGHLEANKAGTVASKAKSLDVHFGGNDGEVSISDSMSGHLEANKAGTMASKAKSLDVHFCGNDDKVSISDSISGHLEANNFDRTKEQPNLPKKGDSPGTDRSISGNNSISVGTIEWASKELLEFVAHMRNGDIYVLSLFDIETLLLEYIKIHNLCDPREKSQIICDLRLRSLFGKPRVGQFEMLKLLEYHCVTKEEPGKGVIQGNAVHDIVSQVEGDGNNANLHMMDKHKKHKTRRKGDERGPQTNLDEYAAIDVHNIKLIYLRRNMMESLLVDSGKFHDKVVGSFVRIRISSSDLHQDIFRLVEVVGTCKVAVPYNIGDKTADFMLEILNLDKKESISIVAVSSQEFSEDECQRLRQSIKCGLVKRLTVGQVREKAFSLQEVRVNDWLGTEITRFTHLRDRASEKGHQKELRECVEKLELLKTPEERLRMLHEIPEVHTDSNMDPKCQSDKDPGVINCNNKQDENVKSRDIGLNGNDPNPNSSLNDDVSYQSGSRSTSSPFCLDKGASSGGEDRKHGSLGTEGNAPCGLNPIEKPGNQVDSSGSVVGSWNNQVGSFSGVGSEASVASLSTGNAPSTYDSEMDKLWHYRDPIGTIQGPFCMMQLRKWSTTGYFPPDMRIWSVNDEEDHSLLLTDALNGHLCKSMPMGCVSLPIQEVIKGSSDSGHNCDAGRGNSSMDEAVAQSNANSGFLNDIQTGSSYSEQPQVSCPAPSFVFSEQSHETSLHQASGHEVQTSSNPGNGISHGNIMHQTTGGQVHENQSTSLTVNCSSNNWNPNSGFASVVKSTDLVEQIFGIDINLPSPTAKTNDGDFSGLSTKNLLSAPSNVFVQDLNIPNLPSYNSKPIDGDEKADSTIQNVSSPLPKPAEDEKAQTTDDKQFVPLNFTVQIPEVSHKWGGYSPTHTKPSFEEWNSSFVSLLKPTEVGNHHAAISTSNCDEISTPSPPHHSSSWLASVTDEPIEISTLAEESVSDLLAEVDAMESQGGGNLASPTSVNGGEDLFHDSKTEYFTSHMALVPPLGKNDGFASREVIKFPPPQLTLTDDRIRAPSQGFFLDPVKRSSGKASISTKLEFETKPTVPFPTRQYMFDGKQMESGVGGGSTQGNTYAGTGSTQGMPRGNSNSNRGSSSGFIGRDTHSKHSGERLDSKYGGERLMSPRERTVHSSRDCDSGFSKGRSPYSRQLSFGGSSCGGSTTTIASSGGGGGYSRPPPKEQRVCKFYESGYCRKGSSCSYFHPR